MAGPRFPTVQATNRYGQVQPGGSVYFGGGGSIPEPFFRDQLDAQRSMYRRIPSAEYPDGYLGTIQSRREDRLLNAVKSRVTQRSYQRGVHKGERIDPADYFWPPDFQPTNGLKAEAIGMRQAPVQTLAERLMATEQQMIPRGSQSLIMMDPVRRARLARLAPNWR